MPSPDGSRDSGPAEDALIPLKHDQCEQFDEEPATKDEQEPPWRSIGIKVAVSILIFILLTLLLEHFCEEPVAKFSTKLMSWIGLPGLFICVFLADGVPQPFTYVPLIFLAVKGAVPKIIVLLVCALGSYSAAIMGYGVGCRIRKLEWGQNLFKKLSDDYPYIPSMMQKKGAIGVALAALLPVPLAIATWTGGYLEIYFPHFLLAGMCRVPKITVFVLLSRGPAANGES